MCPGIRVKQVAVDQDGKVLVWTGKAVTAPPSVTDAAVPPEQAPLAYMPPYLAEQILTSKSALAGERKQVTVLFADLKDSTELIRGLDPKAAQQLLDPAIHCMMDAVHRFEGTVNQVLGDGIMALFGAPIAHEDHALRACYAALAMQTAMRSYTEEVRRTRGLELRMRVGLNSGEVVVRAIGNDLHMDYSAVGETTHLAARMEQLATPGTSRLSAATLRLVEGFVQVTALGPVPVKGLAEPVEVFELLGASHLRRRLQAAAARGLTPFVGRQHELAALHQALAQAQAGHGQVVALVGEAGVGKSRLVYEVLHSHRTQGWRWDLVREVRALVFALDADAAGQQQWRQLARQATLRGKRVAVLPAEAYGGHKDASAAWVAGRLAVGAGPAVAGMGGAGAPELPENLQELWQERAAMIAADGRVPPAEAERLAWVCLCPHDGG